ncbi:MAG TPA: HAMP domain-containing histidine kinase, partial [Bacteroidales bacterium]|nr:HAMP domain-containing histidine kinase [Bacteroidales bacterium]
LELKNIELIKHFAPNLPMVLLDENQFKQVLINLLNNASDAITPPGIITIFTFLDGERVGVSVSDTGCGIKMEEINKIFTPFYTTKPVGKGTGLGLSVSYGIIKNLGGDITVESIPGKGTLFTIYLNPHTNSSTFECILYLSDFP